MNSSTCTGIKMKCLLFIHLHFKLCCGNPAFQSLNLPRNLDPFSSTLSIVSSRKHLPTLRMIKGSGARAKRQLGVLCHGNIPRQTQQDPKRGDFVLLPFLSNEKPPQVQGDSHGQPVAAGEARSALLPLAPSAPDVRPREATFCSVHLEKPHLIWHSLVVSS